MKEGAASPAIMRSPMHFGLDVRPSLRNPTGVGTYVLGLAEHLPSQAPDDRFTFFSASAKERYPSRDWPANVRVVDRRLPVQALNLAWSRLGWPPLDRLVGAPLDLVHSPHPLIVPCRKGKQILTVHDLFFVKHPEMVGGEARRDYVQLVRQHVKRADGVICVSEYTASEVRHLLDVPEEKIAVTPHGIDPIFAEEPAPEAVEQALRRYGLPRGGILYLGSDEKRKNLVNLAMAYMGLSRRRSQLPPLVLVGPGTAWGQGGSTMGPQIRAVGYLETREIRALMAASAALVLPSLEEVAGDAATLVDPLDAGSIATGIEAVLGNPELAQRQRQRGLERSRQFDWDTAAAQTLEFYRRVLAS